MMKRDEWSKEAVSCLLEAYEAKWSLRNRAKLRGRDWHDVATFVSATSLSAKTHTQCKNKIESMKKRYRSELAAADASSSWPLFPRIDRLLRGGNMTLPASPPPQSSDSPPPPPTHHHHQLAKSQGEGKNNDMIKSSEQESNERESRNGKRKIMKGESMVMRWVAEVMVKKEEALMETMREIERIRMEAEEKRDEFQLKQTQIIANVHLQIASLFAKHHHS